MTAALHMTEKQFQDTVVDLAAFHGWRVHHVKPGMTSRGNWLTNVQGHVGFPDLVLAHRGQAAAGKRLAILPTLIFAELKSRTGKLSKHQLEWGNALNAVPGVEYHVWRPVDMERIHDRLRGLPWQN